MRTRTERFTEAPAPGLEGELNEAAARLKLQRVYGETWPVQYRQLAETVVRAELRDDAEFFKAVHLACNEGTEEDCGHDCRASIAETVRETADELKQAIDRAVDEVLKEMNA